MNPLRHARLLLASACAALVGVALAAPPADAATPPQPTPGARSAGIVKPGEAYMGWNTPSPRATPQPQATGGVPGIDVSGWQGNVDWQGQWNLGKRFAYVKATEGTGFRNSYFAQQYTGSYDVGMIRGSYHFALPDRSTGAAQAEFFARNGGGWSRDGKTLPGVLDIEYNPYGASCYGLSQTAMVSWISSFTTRYKQLTGRDAVIYTTTDWWKTCTGSTTRFGATNPLWIARYASTPGELPAGWGYYTFWQYSDTPIDQDTFNGDLARLRVLATG
ncbi:GH25 family lysozyme M1 (1,4-beta-N-acetylmuramidase) [Barrientosiimonas humi]|uniref:Lysozyme n=1 Tax=Barrientosiimonas humi TaxID=999931 RepID=A0A542WZT1_9MICO|nr:lysozyme [Barrientosiimonas humi]TQL29078.1 GH25 family lysozyme M1 (1,4-beta-N-acetylmuramidase) [Barrientosiimonas humi]CAG7571618.1 Lysozyme M1 [Barrientosiimonas humi]